MHATSSNNKHAQKWQPTALCFFPTWESSCKPPTWSNFPWNLWKTAYLVELHTKVVWYKSGIQTTVQALKESHVSHEDAGLCRWEIERILGHNEIAATRPAMINDQDNVPAVPLKNFQRPLFDANTRYILEVCNVQVISFQVSIANCVTMESSMPPP